ncbi:hypothetical protein [Nonomuraea jiangxiensis]|uniref:hypothetical protein n=1 Tax=Nonomuraea jiangxiensis TaxID=633440 RepID=UPI00115F999D|nr:hypothetical protein [Nonomuraea jiangxiensis]
MDTNEQRDLRRLISWLERIEPWQKLTGEDSRTWQADPRSPLAGALTNEGNAAGHEWRCAIRVPWFLDWAVSTVGVWDRPRRAACQADLVLLASGGSLVRT